MSVVHNKCIVVDGRIHHLSFKADGDGYAWSVDRAVTGWTKGTAFDVERDVKKQLGMLTSIMASPSGSDDNG